MRKFFVIAALAASLAALIAVAAATSAGPGGYKTSLGPMIDPVAAGASFDPIISVGDTFFGGYKFESIPDGISLASVGRNGVDIYVNHEASTVPFPYTFNASTGTGSGFNDYTNALVSKLRLHPRTAGVVGASYVIDSDANFQRFCSNFIAGAAQGFDRPLLFTNEEGIDWVNRAGKAWPATIGAPEARQIGAVVAVDATTDTHRPIWGMGRFNHENSVAIPGYAKPVLLSGDDPFVSNPAQSQLYSYIAPNADAVWNDTGDLWAFVSDAADVDDYYDFPVNSTMSVSGRFVKVPKDVATGRRANGTDLMAADKGYPLPPNNGDWQRDARTNLGIDGPQWVLEHWGDIQAKPVFQFVRVEDIAYDRRPGMQNVVYVVDSGRGASGPNGHVDERTHLEARARQDRPDEGDVVLDPDRGRRRPGQGGRRDPPAGQHRVHPAQPPHH